MSELNEEGVYLILGDKGNQVIKATGVTLIAAWAKALYEAKCFAKTLGWNN